MRNAKFKGSSTPKTVTTIDNSSDTVRVFEGFLDFLSCLSLHPNEQPISDTVVLNSAVNLRKALPFLERHRMIHTFLDNDDAGRKATAETIRLCPRCEVIDHAPSYFDHKDLNDFLQMQSDQEQN